MTIREKVAKWVYEGRNARLFDTFEQLDKAYKGGADSYRYQADQLLSLIIKELTVIGEEEINKAALKAWVILENDPFNKKGLTKEMKYMIYYRSISQSQLSHTIKQLRGE